MGWLIAASIVTGVTTAAPSPASPEPAPSIQRAETSAPLEPLRDLYGTASEAEAIRAAVANEPWRAQLVDEITSAADVWLARDEQWMKDMIPTSGSLFAYGQAGCPKCGGRFANMGSDSCSLSLPGKVTCPTCHTVFPDEDPTSPYHDTGRGVMIKGKRHFFIPVWNTFIVNSMWSASGADNAGMSQLTMAYAMTGKEEYAKKAILMMDALATLFPTTLGPRDFDYNDNQKEDKGRLHFLTSTAYRAMVPLARNIDLVGRHPMMQQESPTNPGKTIWENVSDGIFKDYLFKHGDVREAKLSTLHNHEADSVRAMITAGVLYGNADYIRWGQQCLDALLENTVDRDGMYYETSMGYTMFTRSVFVEMADMLTQYSPEKYKEFKGDFPPARNFFDHPKLQKLMVDNFDVDIMGRRVSFGNSHGDDLIIEKSPEAFNTWQWAWLARVGKNASDPELRKYVDKMLAAGVSLNEKDPAGPRWWLFNQARPLPEKNGDTGEFNMFGDGRFFSTKGLAGFQFGDWPHKKAMLVRGGSNLPHAHDDSLGLNLYDLGRDLSGEIGYGVFDTPIHKGWGGRSISHCMVTVDGDKAIDQNGYFKKTPGATWRSFFNGDTVKYLDADGSPQFVGTSVTVEQYRRRMVAVVVDPVSTYYVDLFDVTGGNFRDYSFHGPDNSDMLATQTLTLEGIDLKPIKGAWTLAGLASEFRDASWNAPGKSWGERVASAEAIAPTNPPDGSKGYGWEPPGRGYGFLYNLRGAKTDKPWAATWKLKGDDDAHLRAGFFPSAKMGAYAANAPDRLNNKVFNYVISRDEGDDRSRFLVVLEPYRKQRAIESIEVLRNEESGPVALKVHLRDGRTDLLLLGADADQKVQLTTGKHPISAAAEMAFVRVSKAGKPLHAAMMRGSEITRNGDSLLATKPAVETTLKSVDLKNGSFVVDSAVFKDFEKGNSDSSTLPFGPEGILLAEKSDAEGTVKTFSPVAVISGEGQPTSTTLELKSTKVRPAVTRLPDGSLQINAGGVALQQFAVASVDEKTNTVVSSIPMPLNFVHSKSTRILDGRSIADDSGKIVGRIINNPGIKILTVTPDTKLEVGKLYWVMDFIGGHQIDFPIASVFEAKP